MKKRNKKLTRLRKKMMKMTTTMMRKRYSQHLSKSRDISGVSVKKTRIKSREISEMSVRKRSRLSTMRESTARREKPSKGKLCVLPNSRK